MDVTRIPQEDRYMIPKQVEMYHKYNGLIRTGDLYRIGNLFENPEYDCVEYVSKDKREVLTIYVQVLHRPNYHIRRIRLKGLDKDGFYKNEETNDNILVQLTAAAGQTQVVFDNLNVEGEEGLDIRVIHNGEEISPSYVDLTILNK